MIQSNTPAEPQGNSAASSSVVLPESGDPLHGFFASLTIYELPLQVIYTGLMVMLFRAQTPRRAPLGELLGLRGPEKARVNLLNIVHKRHLQLPTRRRVKGPSSILGGKRDAEVKCTRGCV